MILPLRAAPLYCTLADIEPSSSSRECALFFRTVYTIPMFNYWWALADVAEWFYPVLTDRSQAGFRKVTQLAL
jgi:hypothetical protein